MTNADRPAPDAAVEAAIARVLDAEHQARDAVGDADGAAAALIEMARASARALAERTEHRIRSVRAAFEAQTSETVAMLGAAADAAGAEHDLTAVDLARLDIAVTALAAFLTGEGDR